MKLENTQDRPEKSEAQKRADLQLAQMGMRPYNQDDEPASTSTELIDELVPPVSEAEFLKELHRDVMNRDMKRGAPAVSSEVLASINDNDPRLDRTMVADAQATVGISQVPDGPSDIHTPISVESAESIRQQAQNIDPTGDIQRQQGAA